ncbi:MAG TPA: DUF4124 domain-containing protein, partial [Chitinispirillaceae bacterium]|nr:DUF4124 domain-containing protein [Chitinispirillaceae bacterium]
MKKISSDALLIFIPDLAARGLLPGMILLLALPFLFLPSPAAADIYKYVDKGGVIHLTNVPSQTNVKYDLVMKEKRILFKVTS